MKKTFIIILVGLLILAAAFFFIQKKPTSSGFHTFRSANNSFSFKYPSGIQVAEKDEQVILTKVSDPKTPLVRIAPTYYPKFISDITTRKDLEITMSNLGTYKVYIITSPQYPQIGIQYIVQLQDVPDPSMFLTISVLPNTIGFSQAEFEPIFKSITIDSEKITTMVNDSIASAKAKGFEAKQKAVLSQVRASGELYYQLADTYAGLCAPTPNSKGEAIMKYVYQSMKTDIGSENIICAAKKDAYAFSVRLPNKEMWCVDSTGYFGSTTSAGKGYSCK